MAKVLILGGTTGAGKTSLSLELARAWDAAVVSADAMTVYRRLDIGTAKPTVEERRGVPHYALDVRDLSESFDVSDFVAEVAEACAEHPRVIVAGGTPFYLQARVRPRAALPGSDPAVRSEVEALPDPHARLQVVDPESAARLHPNDRVRVVRALEVYRLTGSTLTELHARGAARPPLDAAVAWLDRPDLSEQVDLRLEWMLGAGYLDEARGLLDQGVDPTLKPLRSFSYRHMIGHVQGALSLDEAVRRTRRDTLKLARRQRTWARGLGWAATDPDSVRRLGQDTFSV